MQCFDEKIKNTFLSNIFRYFLKERKNETNSFLENVFLRVFNITYTVGFVILCAKNIKKEFI